MAEGGKKPHRVSVVVDNESWVLPYARALISWSMAQGNIAKLCRTHDEVEEGAVAFYLGCVKITPPAVLARNQKNLVAHASDLPHGRGFSPWTYAILEGKNRIPLCLIEAAEEVDTGPIIYKEWIDLSGTELVEEIRDLLGRHIVDLCCRYLSEPVPPEGKAQSGEASVYPRRTPKDSRLDPEQTIAAQFDLLRVVDNEHYPAFFDYKGRRYKIRIEPDERDL
ncbi:MAG: methionyl-tRNA formyltransferase [Alphaproteobacteria bacterium]|nr:methionyl-tRNA formyltransferase [Alphaproteobacteria bacterium]